VASLSRDLQWVWDQFVKIQTPQMVELATAGHAKWQGFVDKQQGELEALSYIIPTIEIASSLPLIRTDTRINEQAWPMNNIMYEWCMKNVEDWKGTLDYKDWLNSSQGKIGLFLFSKKLVGGWFIHKGKYTLLNLDFARGIGVADIGEGDFRTGPETSILMTIDHRIEEIVSEQTVGGIIKLWQEAQQVINWREFPAGLLE